MPSFVRDEKTVAAAWWAEGEYAVIRRFGYGDDQAMAGELVKITGTGDEAEIQWSDELVGRMNLRVLELGLVRWTDADGDEVPVTPAAIRALEPDDAEFLLGEIQALNKNRRQRSPDEQDMFRD